MLLSVEFCMLCSLKAVAAAATAQQARSPINAGAKVRHMPRPSLLNIDDDYMEANAAAGSGPVQVHFRPLQPLQTLIIRIHVVYPYRTGTN